MPIVTGDTFDQPLIFRDSEGVVVNLSTATEIKVSIVSVDHSRVLAGPITAVSNYRDSNWTLGRVVIPITGSATATITDGACLIEAQVTMNGQTTYFPAQKVQIVKGLVS